MKNIRRKRKKTFYKKTFSYKVSTCKLFYARLARYRGKPHKRIKTKCNINTLYTEGVLKQPKNAKNQLS